MNQVSEKELLYGYANIDRIVASERVFRPGVAGTMMEVFIQKPNGNVSSKLMRIEPCVYINDKHEMYETLDEFGLEGEKLRGNGYYNTRVIGEGKDIRDFIKKFEHTSDVFIISNQALGMLQYGATFYRSMKFTDVKSLYLDIEVINPSNAEFVNSQRRGDKIVIISASYVQGADRYSIVYYLPHKATGKAKCKADELKVFDDEAELLKEFIGDFAAEDPTFVFGHNICDFDMQYIQDRCKMHGIKFNIGRNGEEPYSRPASMKLAERSINYTHWHVYGRHLIDTMHLAMKADIVKREFPDYKLKSLVDYLDMTSEDRVFIDGDEITTYWEKYPNELLAYALEDVMDTEKLSLTFGQAFFYLSQMLPYGYQDCVRLGSGSLVQSIFLREYIRQWHSFPKPEMRQKIPGGFAGVFVFGHIGAACIYIDVASLYPTLAEELVIKPERDELGIYQLILKVLKSRRLEIKESINAAKDEAEKSSLKSTDGSVKIVLNTQSYGILASETFLWNDYSEAARITTNGQKIIKSMMAAAESLGGIPVKVDTDGMLVALPKTITTEAEEKAFTKKVEDHVNKLISEGLFND